METKDSQIIQQNRILLGGQTINLRARQLVYVLAALMDKENPTGEICINARDLLDFINTTTGEKWSDIYNLTSEIFDHLNKNPILIKEPNKKDFIKVNWLSSLGVIKGTIRARFSVDISDYFLYRQGLPYTKLLWDLRPYKSNFTARIMDLFQRFHKKESGIEEIEFEYDLENLKLFFGVHNKYKRFFDFEKRVLETTRRELEENDLAPYWFSYTKTKQGRNIKAIKFTVYVRPQVLLEMIPSLRMLEGGREAQITIFDAEREGKFSATKKKLFTRLMEIGLNKMFAEKVLYNLSDTQGIAYFYLVEYGVNKTLAFTIVKEHCSFGELENNEHQYVKFTLGKIEEARLKRIAANREGKSKKRITPEDKRGGLAKKPFVERQYFGAFMEELSKIRRQDSPPKRTQGTQGLGTILRGVNIPK